MFNMLIEIPLLLPKSEFYLGNKLSVFFLFIRFIITIVVIIVIIFLSGGRGKGWNVDGGIIAHWI